MVKLIVLLVLLYMTYQVVREALGLRQKRHGYFQRVYRDVQQAARRPGVRSQPKAERDTGREIEEASWEDVT